MDPSSAMHELVRRRKSNDPKVAAEQERQDRGNLYAANIYVFVFAGIVGVLFVRNVVLLGERLWHHRAAQRRAQAGEATETKANSALAQQPFFARQSAKVENILLRPLGAKYVFPGSWTVLQFVLTLAIVVLNIIACTVIVFTVPKGVQLSNVKFLGMRTGRLSTANMPLLYALAGRNNVVGWLTGIDYHSIRTYHKLVGLICFIEAAVHTLCYTANYVEGSGVQRLTSIWTNPQKHQYLQWGTAAVISAMFCCVLAAGLIRRRGYELFLLSHIAGAAVFLAGAYKHRRSEMYNWIYAAVAVWCFERVWRATRVVFNRCGFHRPVLQADAQVVNGAILLSIPFPEGGWRAGQHFYLYFWGAGFLIKPWLYGQAHPFTVANSPGSNVTHLEFVIKIHDGVTSSLAQMINKRGAVSVKLPVTVEGPYSTRPRSEEFDSVLLLGGGSGITYVSSVLSDIVRRGREGSAIKTVKFVWAIQHVGQAQWIRAYLQEARAYADRVGLDLSIDLYVTRDDSFPHSASDSSMEGSPVTSGAASFTDDKKDSSFSRPSIATEELGRANIHYVRPDADFIVQEFIRKGGEGRVQVLSCGPTSLGDVVRLAGAKVARAKDEVYVASFDG